MTMKAKRVKNVTFSLPVELLDKYRNYAEDNYIPSLNCGVREALEEYAKHIDKEKLRQQMLKASKDPLFIKDLENTMKTFQNSDIQSSQEIPEW